MERRKKTMPDQFTEESFRHLQEQDTDPEFLPCGDDVVAYLGFIRNMPDYKGFVEDRIETSDEQLETLLKTGQITPEEYREWKGERTHEQRYEEHARVFEDTELFKGFYWNVYEDVAHLVYNPDRYSRAFNEAYRAYKVGVCVEMETARGRNGKSVSNRRVDKGLYAVSLDRSRLHDEAAGALLKELPVLWGNDKLARIIVRSFLVDEHFDYIASARQADLARALRSAPDISKPLVMAGWEKGPPRFPVERAIYWQQRFSEDVVGSLPECKKSSYQAVDYHLINSYPPNDGD